MRILSAKKGEMPVIELPESHTRRSGKWDYTLNDAFRVAVDVSCLAQLVHGIVLHETIAITPDYADRWGATIGTDPSNPRIHPPEGASGLGDVLRLFSYAGDDYRVSLLGAGERAVRLSAMDAFRAYLGELAEGGVLGAWLDISNGYFETGYSDYSITPPFAFEPEGPEIGRAEAYVANAKSLALQARAILADAPRGGRKGEARRQEAGRLAALSERFLSVFEALRSIDRNDHALIRTPIPPGDKNDKLHAAHDLVANAAAAFYYQELAAAADVPYLPHPMRGPSHQSVQSGEGDLQSLDEELAGIRSILMRWSGEVLAGETAVPTVSLGINAGFVSISKDLVMRLPAGTPRRRRQVRFLHDLMRIGDTTTKLAPNLARVFGDEVAEHWSKATAVFGGFRAGGRRTSMLDLRP